MPAPGPALVSMAQQFTGLPMQDLIGGPLMAAAQANSKMAMTQVKYLMDLAFEETTSGDDISYKPIMIDMVLKRPVIEETTSGNGGGSGGGGGGDVTGVKMTTAESKISLPLLTILPLNSLAVETVDINFNMEVKSSYSEDTNESAQSNTNSQGSFKAKYNAGLFSVTVKGSVSHSTSSSQSHDTHYEKSNSAEYTVSVHAGQLPLPPGVTTIITAYTNAIAPIEVSSGTNGGGGGGGGG